jgi:alpha,alpha-trehalase
MEIRYRGHSISVEIVPEKVKITACKSCEAPIKIGFKEKVHELKEQETLELEL